MIKDWRDEIKKGDLLSTLAGDREVIDARYKNGFLTSVELLRKNGSGRSVVYNRWDILGMGMKPKFELPQGKVDGRALSGNNPISVLCRLSGEIAYVQKRLCIRNSVGEVRDFVSDAAAKIEQAIDYLRKTTL